MKKFTAILCLSALATGAFAQGTVTAINGTYSLARTNATGLGGTAGSTAPSSLGFYYGLFTAASTVTSVDANLQNLLSGTWTFTGLYATNLASAGRLSGGAGVATTQGWTPGVTNSYLLLGWSANIAQFDILSVSNQLRGASDSSGVWTGPNFAAGSNRGFIGVTAIGFGEAGGGTTGLGPFPLFGTTPTSAGTPIGSPFDMFVVNVGAVPEPSSFALAGLGAAALLIFRRRK